MLARKHFDIQAGNYDEAGKAASEIKRTLKLEHCSKELIKRVSVASYEAEINIVIHSVGGFADCTIDDHAVYLQFVDHGPGIADIALAMTEGYSTASDESRLNGFGAGMGLSNIQKSADEMTLISDVNGTILKLKFHREGDDSHDSE
ncbi:MAG: hypothetical protein PHP32_05415 [Candidatus Izemoplasmatales bacterium]|nr:hypothetical protein [Candidatus Izemoplasmatales bacterium]